MSPTPAKKAPAKTTTTTAPNNGLSGQGGLSFNPGSSGSDAAPTTINWNATVPILTPGGPDQIGLGSIIPDVGQGHPAETIQQRTQQVASLSEAQMENLASLLQTAGLASASELRQANGKVNPTNLEKYFSQAMNDAATAGRSLNDFLYDKTNNIGTSGSGSTIPTSPTYSLITDPVQVASEFDNQYQQMTGGLPNAGQRTAFVTWFHNNQITAAVNKEETKGLAQGLVGQSGSALSPALSGIAETFSSDPTAAAQYWVKTNAPVDYGRYMGLQAADTVRQSVAQGQGTIAPDVRPVTGSFPGMT